MTPEEVEAVARAIVRERCAQKGEPMPEGPLTDEEIMLGRVAIAALDAARATKP